MLLNLLPMSLGSRSSQFQETKRFGSSLLLPERESAAAGTVIADKYRLERLLGEGGGGSVWHATNLLLEVPVAIKLLRAGAAQSELGERLRVEARAAARLVHPSIVRVFDVGEAAPDEPFIVMELLSGESLGDRIHRDRPSPIEAVRLLLPIAEALAVAHAAGVIHRDLKPDNVLLCPEGQWVRPKLFDFGVAKIEGGGKRTNLTQRGTLVGSPSYMSPEQARGAENLDFRTDIWSFCVVLYEALSGVMPFDAPDGGALLRAVIQDAPRPLARIRGVDEQLWSLIEQGLSKPPSLRPSSMTELGRELARWLRRHGIDTDAAGTPLGARWLPRSGSAPPPRERTLMLVAEEYADAPPRRPSGGGSAGSGPERTRPRPFSRPAASRAARKAPRVSRKQDPRKERLMVLGATAGTLLSLFLGVLWAVGVFEDDPPTAFTSRYDALGEHVPVVAAQIGVALAPAPPASNEPSTAPAPEPAVVPAEPVASAVAAPVSVRATPRKRPKGPATDLISPY
jgi:serine/threonine protein kinase